MQRLISSLWGTNVPVYFPAISIFNVRERLKIKCCSCDVQSPNFDAVVEIKYEDVLLLFTDTVNVYAVTSIRFHSEITIVQTSIWVWMRVLIKASYYSRR